MFYENRWVCSAFAHDSKAGREVTGERVLLAQRRQKKHIDMHIQEKKMALKQVDQEITAQQQREEQQHFVTSPTTQESQHSPEQEETTEGEQKSAPASTSTKKRGEESSLSTQPSPKPQETIWETMLAETKRRAQTKE